MEQNNQFFLSVIAAVALVAIVSLVALVLNVGGGSAGMYIEPSLEQAAPVENVVGEARGFQHGAIAGSCPGGLSCAECKEVWSEDSCPCCGSSS